ELSDLYEISFAHAEPALKMWADESLAYIRESWAQGWMPLARERASTKIVDIYGTAKKSIIATNVGSTNFYFGDATYAAANANARLRGVPVVRFYIYGEKLKGEIAMHDGKHPENIEAFYKEVKYLHNRLGSLYSAVIDVDRLKVEPRDLLIVDGKFL